MFSAVACFALVCAIGVAGYRSAGWDAMDAVYMVIITVFGVGYGEVQPITTPGLRALTMGLIVGGYAAAVYVVGTLVQFVTEGEINRAMGARRMTRGIDQLVDHTIICGYGRIGRILARELGQAKLPFVVVDASPDKILDAEAAGCLVVSGDAAREDVLERAGVARAARLATVLPSDAANVFVTLTATGLNHHLEVIARAEDPASEKKLRRSGASTVVMPAAIGAERISHMVMRPGAAELLAKGSLGHVLRDELLKLGLEIAELRITAQSSLVSRTVGEIEVRGNRGFLIVGIRRRDGSVVVNPDASEPLAEDDTVVVVGHPQDLPELRARFELEPKIVYRGALRG